MENLFTDVLGNLASIVSGVNFSMAAEVVAQAEEAAPAAFEFGATAESNYLTANNIWMMLSTALVFIMHLGFATVETGFCQSKNTVNVLFKNTLTPIIGLLLYWLCGFNLMYPGFEAGVSNFLGFAGFGISLPEGYDAFSYVGGGYTYWTDFLFQGMFAATCATIVSGAVAERVKIEAYLPFTVIFVGIVYPILGSWHWGYGWLNPALPEGFDSWEAFAAAGNALPWIVATTGNTFYDFAGSTLVHSVGGWGALAGIWVIGARIGKYKDGKVNDFPGASVPLAVIGVFLLWLGWFGFNGGSVLSADPELVSYVLVTTSLAACTGGLFGVITGSLIFKRLDLGMALNGILAGLVGITASADCVSVPAALLIGAVSGVLVVFAAITFDKFKLDDCVGATSVHLVCGIWGTLAAGIFGEGHSVSTQLVGILAYGAVAFPAALLIFLGLKYTIGVRVKEENEINGLDSHEHGIRGYTILVP